MKKGLTYTVFLDMLFLLLLVLSGFMSGAFSDILYYMSFLVPIMIFFPLSKRLATSNMTIRFKPRASDFTLTLIIAPAVLGVVFSLAALSALLSSTVVGTPGGTDVSGNIASVILLHAMLPAVLEELLFRYVPITFIGGESKSAAVIFSSLLFALSHCDIFKLPYTLAAGIIFAVIVASTGSVWPTVILHFLNNTVSIIWQKYVTDATSTAIFLSVFGLMILTSVFVILIKRKSLIETVIIPVFREKCKFEFTKELGAFVILALFISVATLI